MNCEEYDDVVSTPLFREICGGESSVPYRTLLAAKVNLDVLEYKGQKYAAPSPAVRLKMLVKAIRSDAPSVSVGRSDDIRWRFANVFYDTEHSVIFGRVCKISDEIRERAPERQEPIVEVQPDTVIASAHFLFDPKSELLVFEQRSPDISPPTFIEAFRKLCVNTRRELGDLNITLLPDRTVLRNELKTFRTITIAEFSIVHANWLHDTALNALDEQLKKARAREGSIKLKNPRGLQLDSEIIEDGLTMVENGYGHVKLSGYDRSGRRKKMDSRNNLIQEKISIDGDQHTWFQGFLSFLYRVKEVIQGGG